ncbi:MAG: MucR family transcriptional regulator [Pseudomonadota bacterium]
MKEGLDIGAKVMAQTADIVAAYVSHNPVSSSDLPALMTSVHEQLRKLADPDFANSVVPEPAVPIKKSVTRHYLVCLEDGQKLKMLKRYLRTRYNLSPEEYRSRWGLPSNYPMVAPEYAERRSKLAKEAGLGKAK